MRTALTWLLAISLALVLAGCPGSNSNKPSKRRTKVPKARGKTPTRKRPNKRVATRKVPKTRGKTPARRKVVKRAKPKDTTLVISWFPSAEVLPLLLMEQKGLLKKHAKKLKAKVKLKRFSDSVGSVHAYNTQKVQGCAMDSLNALRSAIRGTPSLYALPLSASRGSYALVLRRGVGRRSFVKKKIFVEQYGLGHYLLTRYLRKKWKRPPKKLQLINISVRDSGEAFLSDKNIKVAVTTRSYAATIRKKKIGRILFDSSKDPHALQFGLLLRQEHLKKEPNALKAFALAYAEAVALLNNKKSRPDALKLLAKAQKKKSADILNQLDGWHYFGDLKDTRKYLGSKAFRRSLEGARQFLYDKRMLSSLPSAKSLGLFINGKSPKGSVISRLVVNSSLLP